MRHPLLLAVVCIAVSAPHLSAALVTPAPLAAEAVAQDPYAFTGLLVADGRTGTASLVAEGVVLAPAHLLFDAHTGQWAQDVRFYPGYHAGSPPSPQGGLQPADILYWPDFGTRIMEDDPVLRSPDTSNVDVAVLYFPAEQTDPRLLRHAELQVDPAWGVGFLRDPRDKIIVGYPLDPAFIDAPQRGLMHATAPGDYPAAWDALEELPETWLDSGGLWTATYAVSGVTTHAGNGGYPVFARSETGRWVHAGLVVSPIGGSAVRVRAIDENAWALIEQAIAARGAPGLHRVTNLARTRVTETSASLIWRDMSSGEAGYAVERLDRGAWQTVAELPADSESFTDESVQPGHVYAYRVQAFSANGNRAPASWVVKTATPGGNATAAAALGQPWLRFTSDGDSNWHQDGGNGLRAGRVRSLGESILQLDLLGPGTLGFDWSVSSEANPDYANPDSPQAGVIFDAVHLYLNGQPVMDNGEPVFLSGEVDPVRRQLALPDGPQLVEWRYRKNAYTSAGEDTAYLSNLSWDPATGHPDPVYGAFVVPATGRHTSEWFGTYSADSLPWVYHEEMGWLWLRRHPDGGDQLVGYSMDPEIGFFQTGPGLFPWLYSFTNQSWRTP